MHSLYYTPNLDSVVLELKISLLYVATALFLCVTPASAQVTLQQVASGLSRPVVVAESPLSRRTLFVAEQEGKIKIVKNRGVLSRPFLDLSSKISIGSEQGLLGFAFDPNFKSNRRVFVNYTRKDGATVVSSFTTSSRDATIVNSRSEVVRLTVQQPFSNHNGGNLLFGPDGLLYIGLGDGGSGGDPENRAQDLSSLLGKMLRINVSSKRGYTVPRDNPFVNSAEARPEIYAYGLRNPWRYSFDTVTKRLFIGDVGQNTEEEITLAESGDNLGWRIREGNTCFDADQGCSRPDLRAPIITYPRSDGQSVTGGFVYRGKRIQSLIGKYIFADFITGTVFQAQEENSGEWTRSVLLSTGRNISTFGTRSNGELLIADYGGTIFNLVSAQ